MKFAYATAIFSALSKATCFQGVSAKVVNNENSKLGPEEFTPLKPGPFYHIKFHT